MIPLGFVLEIGDNLFSVLLWAIIVAGVVKLVVSMIIGSKM